MRIKPPTLPTSTHVFVAHRAAARSDTLGASGVGDQDVIQMVPAQAQAGGGQQRRAPDVGLNADGSARDPAAFIAAVRADAATMGNLRVQNPRFADAVQANDTNTVQELLRAMHKWVQGGCGR